MTEPSALRSGAAKAPPPRRFRLSVASRLMVTLSTIAALSAAISLVLNDRSLTADLGHAAERRLERASRAARSLADDHVEAMRERYEAVSGTPQLRANLEVDHTPTLEFYAGELRRREGATLLIFLDRGDRPITAVGDRALLDRALGAGPSALFSDADDVYATVSTELFTSAGRVGRLVAVEHVEPHTLERWSELCGAEVTVQAPGAGDEAALQRTALPLGDRELVVVASLEAERAALSRSRWNLLTAGGLAVALSLVACLAMARSFVRPILAMRVAAERIRAGDLALRLRSRRADEIGDVERAFDLMLEDLVESRRAIERNVEALEQSRAHLANAQRMARLGSFEVTVEKGEAGELRGSRQFREIFGLPAGDAPIELARVYEQVHPEDRPIVEDALVAGLRAGSSARCDFRVRTASGERIMHLEGHAGRDEKGGIRRLEGTVQDVTERRRADEQIRYLAYHDSLTGLGNRRLFADRVALAITQARRRQGACLGILFLDLDHFKRINDTLGHSVGDELVRAFADRLVACIRETDVVSRRSAAAAGDAISRLGGDEFTVLLTGIANAEDLSRVAQRVLDTLTRPFDLEGHEVVVGASIGIAAWPNDGDDVESLLRAADSAMYLAKQRGRNRYEFYDESINESAMQRLQLEARIRRGLLAGEFRMHYQPKVDIATWKVVGYEALMRWRAGDGSYRSPGEFIPVAEQCGLIVALGELALEECCRQLAAWQADPPGGTAPRISVNISARQFASAGIVETIERVLAESGADPHGLEIEITETAVMHDEKLVVSILERLHELGVGVSLDDFGTGQSSLSYLRTLPVDSVKIDMSFIQSITENDRDARLTAAIVAMGKARGLCTVAEGVESAEQLALLRAWGCDQIQGFLVSPALPPEEIAALVEGLGGDS